MYELVVWGDSSFRRGFNVAQLAYKLANCKECSVFSRLTPIIRKPQSLHDRIAANKQRNLADNGLESEAEPHN